MSSFLQIVGAVTVAAGLWMQWPWVGVAVLGFNVVLFAVASEIGRLRRGSVDARESPDQ